MSRNVLVANESDIKGSATGRYEELVERPHECTGWGSCCVWNCFWNAEIMLKFCRVTTKREILKFGGRKSMGWSYWICGGKYGQIFVDEYEYITYVYMAPHKVNISACRDEVVLEYEEEGRLGKVRTCWGMYGRFNRDCDCNCTRLALRHQKQIFSFLADASQHLGRSFGTSEHSFCRNFWRARSPFLSMKILSLRFYLRIASSSCWS